MSREGTILWGVCHETRDTLGKLAIGTTSFYYICRSPSAGRRTIIGRSLEDGSIVFQEDIPFVWGQPAYSPLELFGNRKWAVFEDEAAMIRIVDTVSGKMIPPFSHRGQIVFSSREEKFWDYRSEGSRRPGCESTYDADTKAFISKRILLRLEVHEVLHTFWGTFDGDRHFYLRVEERDRGPMLRLSIASLTAQELFARRVTTFGEQSVPAMVTVPTERPGNGSIRQKLEVTRPRRMPDLGTAFCCIAGDYLILHSPTEKELVLVDFWPDW